MKTSEFLIIRKYQLEVCKFCKKPAEVVVTLNPVASAADRVPEYFCNNCIHDYLNIALMGTKVDKILTTNANSK